MRVVITGCAGFIGSSLCNHLLNCGKKVIGIDNFVCGYKENMDNFIDRQSFEFHEISITDKSLINIIQKDDIVIHLAAISSLASNQENPYFSYNNNVAGTANLLELCRYNGIKYIIFASTSAIYENNDVFPLHEENIVKPNLLYSLGKKHCEELIQSFCDIYGLPYTTLRFFNVYGPNQDGQRKHPPLIPYLIDCYKNNTPPLLHSDGYQKRDYIYIDDMLELFDILLEKDCALNTALNLCSGEVVSVKEIVELVKLNFNSEMEPIYREPELLWEKSKILWEGQYTFSQERMKNEVLKYCIGSTEKTKNLLNWQTTTLLKEGIQKIYSSYSLYS
jgi:nucleoside-diphosphate-sugar epimerase